MLGHPARGALVEAFDLLEGAAVQLLAGHVGVDVRRALLVHAVGRAQVARVVRGALPAFSPLRPVLAAALPPGRRRRGTAVVTLAAGALTTLSPTTTLEAAAGRARPGLPAIPAGTGATGAVPAALATGAVGGTIPTEAVG
ncbi:hypothetical protein GCM10022241_23100 [Micrococcus endophyticus]